MRANKSKTLFLCNAPQVHKPETFTCIFGNLVLLKKPQIDCRWPLGFQDGAITLGISDLLIKRPGPSVSSP